MAISLACMSNNFFEIFDPLFIDMLQCDGRSWFATRGVWVRVDASSHDRASFGLQYLNTVDGVIGLDESFIILKGYESDFDDHGRRK